MNLSRLTVVYNLEFEGRLLILISFSYTLSPEYRVRDIDIHGCYSLVKIAFAPIWACKNNRRI